MNNSNIINLETKFNETLESFQNEPYYTIIKLYNSNNLLLENYEFMKIIVSRDPIFISFAKESLLNNKEFIKEFFLNKIKNYCYRNIPKYSYDDDIYNILPSKIREDKEIVFLAIKEKKSLYYSHLSEELKNDHDLSLEAVISNNYMYNFVPIALKNDIQFINDCIDCGANIYKYMKGNSFWNDKNIILKFIEINSQNYYFIPDDFKNDLEIIHIILTNNDNNNNNFHKNFIVDNKDLILTNKNLIILSINKYMNFFSFLDDEYKKDRDILIALILNGQGFVYIKNFEINDKKIFFDVVEKNPNIYSILSKELRNDKEIILTLFSYNEKIIEQLENIILEDHDFIIKLFEKSKNKAKFLENINQTGLKKEFINHILNNHINYINILHYKPITEIEIVKNILNGKINPDIYDNIARYSTDKYIPLVFAKENQYIQKLSNVKTIFLLN